MKKSDRIWQLMLQATRARQKKRRRVALIELAKLERSGKLEPLPAERHFSLADRMRRDAKDGD